MRIKALVAFAGLFASASAYGSTIDLGTILANPSFELGNQADGCPVDWSCTGSPEPGFSSYVVTSAQYTAGADGLASGIVPDGTSAATSPTFIEGSGVLSQQTGLGVYDAGDTYELDLWTGTPETLPTDNVTPVAPVGTVTQYFTGTGGGQLAANSVTIPDVGDWIEETFDFTPSLADIGQPIGIDIFVDSSPEGGGNGNDRIANFDIGNTGGIGPPNTPPPWVSLRTRH